MKSESRFECVFWVLKNAFLVIFPYFTWNFFTWSLHIIASMYSKNIRNLDSTRKMVKKPMSVDIYMKLFYIGSIRLIFTISRRGVLWSGAFKIFLVCFLAFLILFTVNLIFDSGENFVEKWHIYLWNYRHFSLVRNFPVKRFFPKKLLISTLIFYKNVDVRK